MIEKFKLNIERDFPELKTAKIYLAISGGKDSMTLSHLLLKSGLKHTLLHCNFQLRGKESDEDEKFLLDYAKTHSLEIFIKHFDTVKIAETENLTIQECARKLRYDWFNSLLKNEPAFLLTAHHLDDSIETFFINLFRGTGYRGLSGIPFKNEKVLRPLYNFTAEEIYHYIDLYDLHYRSDSSNAKRDYKRNKIRQDLIPVLLELESDIRPKMAALFDELTGLKNYLDAEVEGFKIRHQKKNENALIFPIDTLLHQNKFFIEQLFSKHGIHRKNGTEFLKFLQKGSGKTFTTTDYEFFIDRTDLIIRENKNEKKDIVFLVEEFPVQFELNSQVVSIQKSKNTELETNSKKMQQLDAEKIKLPLKIRVKQEGDKMIPLGMNGSKLISDIVTDKKISLLEKEKILLIEDASGEVICMIGYVISEKVKLKPETKEVIEIVVKR